MFFRQNVSVPGYISRVTLQLRRRKFKTWHGIRERLNGTTKREVWFNKRVGKASKAETVFTHIFIVVDPRNVSVFNASRIFQCSATFRLASLLLFIILLMETLRLWTDFALLWSYSSFCYYEQFDCLQEPRSDYCLSMIQVTFNLMFTSIPKPKRRVTDVTEFVSLSAPRRNIASRERTYISNIDWNR